LTLIWKATERQRWGWYTAGARMSKSQFRNERDAATAAVRDGEDPLRVIRGQRKAWATLYLKLYAGVAADFAPRTIGELKSTYPGVTKAGSADEWMRIVTDYVRRYSGEKIRGIEATTLGLVRNTLADGVGAGEGTDQLAARVRDAYDAFSTYRSERISRTEVVSASNLGSHAGAKSTGLDLTKSWLATRDQRTRDDHNDVDGQRRAMDEPFDVAGEQLQWPGDTSMGAGPGNVIQCRCVCTYEAR
jgi:SPP1 gp7 family putative phage head morphogenesis protein